MILCVCVKKGGITYSTKVYVYIFIRIYPGYKLYVHLIKHHPHSVQNRPLGSLGLDVLGELLLAIFL